MSIAAPAPVSTLPQPHRVNRQRRQYSAPFLSALHSAVANAADACASCVCNKSNFTHFRLCMPILKGELETWTIQLLNI